MTTRSLVTALILTLAASAAGASPPQVHGADAVFIGEAVSVVWSVLRGGDEASTLVVITVIARAPRGWTGRSWGVADAVAHRRLQRHPA